MESGPELNPAPDLVEDDATLDELREAAGACQACELYRAATQVVFGAGPSAARLMLVGEQPGDVEDREGEPFVGPAGTVLDEALAEAGIPGSSVYLTNVVKHFRWKPQGKRRLHQTPATRHIRACLPWLEAELATVRPAAIVCLGAVAAKALLGDAFRVTKDHGKPLEWRNYQVVATIHPSSALRAREPQERSRLKAMLVEDLESAMRLVD
ncbi:MAG: UdgX family uracil-DNA binding protein [Acidimicrobiia bacterium]